MSDFLIFPQNQGYSNLGDGFKDFYSIWGINHFGSYVSMGLKPPTNYRFIFPRKKKQKATWWHGKSPFKSTIDFGEYVFFSNHRVGKSYMTQNRSLPLHMFGRKVGSSCWRPDPGFKHAAGVGDAWNSPHFAGVFHREAKPWVHGFFIFMAWGDLSWNWGFSPTNQKKGC